MTGGSELRINCLATPAAAGPMRHALAAFLSALDVRGEAVEDILTAVGEALANAVEHAYDASGQPRDIELLARLENSATLAVEVFDRGTFIERPVRAGRGFGLRIVRAIAREVTVETDGGTRVRMTFGPLGERTPAL
jgi:anti-sigma regulatory factor (Ser/Thr protein kinase)